MSLFRVASGFMAAVFLFAAAVQYNDPDPVRWMAIYGLAALVCGLALAGRLPRLAPIVVGLAALIWAATIAPGVVGRVSVGDLFESFTMKSQPVEEAREMGGLLIVTAWMGLLALVGPGRG
jgi:Transmembrane family 220, helix